VLVLQHITYVHPDKHPLFDDISFRIGRQQKIALVGNNGAGKSTLLKIIAGVLQPSAGTVEASSKPYYVPQLFGQFKELTIAGALGIEDKLAALHAILDGEVTGANLAALDEDWSIEERCAEALAYWGLGALDLRQKMETLSGGQKTKVFLAGISIHRPEAALLDEPSNHLDASGRRRLYEFIRSSPAALVVASHDRALLGLLDTVYELSRRGITVYGGNYEFYAAQKAIEINALDQDVQSREKALRKAKEVARETAERQQKLDARGRKKQEKAGVPTIALNTLRNKAEQSTSRIKDVQAGKIGAIEQDLAALRKNLPAIDKMRFGFDDSALHKGKTLFRAAEINYSYGGQDLWPQPLSFEIRSGERLALEGLNGAGKTTLIRIILGALEPTAGAVYRADNKAVYVDQDYSLISNGLTVYEQAQAFNGSALQEHEIKIRLSRFLFAPAYWDKPCGTLSGGEKMRLMLCCLTIGNTAPDLIILDEPTNNLDIQNVGILRAAISDYRGTLIVVSHDRYFLGQAGVERALPVG
jgi:ATPase subunit of ABC transporter with duplicated ATPase domains